MTKLDSGAGWRGDKQYRSIYGDDYALVWLMFEHMDGTGNYDEDLGLGHVDYGPDPEHWLSAEQEQVDWQDMLGFDWVQIENDLGWCFVQTYVTFALELGVAPFQPFLIRFEKPVYDVYRPWEGGVEIDVEYSWDLVAVSPLSDEHAAERWAAWLEVNNDYRSRALAAMQDLIDRQRTDVDAMYLKSDSYFAQGQSWRDAMCMPRGKSLTLRTRHTRVEGFDKGSWGELAHARRDDGDSALIYQELHDKVVPEILTEEQWQGLRQVYW